MTPLYLIISILVTLIWFYYFSSINIFSKPNFKIMLFAFGFGLLSVPIIDQINSLFENFILKVFLEEFFKIGFFVAFYFIFKKHFKEPFDYVIYISMVALGFSVLENWVKFEVTSSYGTLLIVRNVFGPVGHITYGLLAVYGWLKFKYDKNKKHNYIVVVKFLLMAIIFHSIHNYITVNQASWGSKLDLSFFNSKTIAEDSKLFNIQWALVFISIYALFLSSAFSTIINNTLNNSKDFNYKKIINHNNILSKLMIGYGCIFVLQLILYLINHYDALNSSQSGTAHDAQVEFVKTSFKVFLFAFTIVAVIMRISRFNFLKGKWRKVKIELPFYFLKDNYLLKLKGDSYQESQISSFHKEFFNLKPVNNRKTFIKSRNKAFLEEKIIDENQNTYFLVKLFKSIKAEDFDFILLKSRTTGTKSTIESYPIVYVYEIKALEDLVNIETNFHQFKLLDLAYVRDKI